jgi:uncharacterized protein (DUF1697 family)
MTTYIALLRGINVGGANILPMKELVAVLERLGLENVRTYIQSGNVVFQSTTTDANQLSQTIKTAVGESHGLAPEVLVLSIGEFNDAIAACPFTDGDPDPKTLHLSFLASIPSDPDLDRLEVIRSPSERFQLAESVFYLYAPEGIGRSKLAANVERAIGVTMTARNWRTVTKLMSMAEELAAP